MQWEIQTRHLMKIIRDDIDDCVGEYDDCGVCNGGNADMDCGGSCNNEYVDLWVCAIMF